MVLNRALDETTRTELCAHVKSNLGSYARGDDVVRGVNDPGAGRLLKEAMDWPKVRLRAIGADAAPLPKVRLIDRRVVGATGWFGPKNSLRTCHE